MGVFVALTVYGRDCGCEVVKAEGRAPVAQVGDPRMAWRMVDIWMGITESTCMSSDSMTVGD